MSEQRIDIMATLVFDSWTGECPDLRAGSAEYRHLIYEGGGIILDLLLKHADNGACLHVGGQVLPGNEQLNEVSDLSVQMMHGKSRSHTHTNALGEFMFHAVPNGNFDLTITLMDKRFNVRGLSSTEPKMWRVVPSLATGGA